MTGIDDVGGQVYPDAEDKNTKNIFGCEGDSEFYHYALGKPVIRWLDAWRWEEV